MSAIKIETNGEGVRQLAGLLGDVDPVTGFTPAEIAAFINGELDSEEAGWIEGILREQASERLTTLQKWRAEKIGFDVSARPRSMRLLQPGWLLGPALALSSELVPWTDPVTGARLELATRADGSRVVFVRLEFAPLKDEPITAYAMGGEAELGRAMLERPYPEAVYAECRIELERSVLEELGEGTKLAVRLG
ncbi:MAG: hypothetical protein ACI8UO_003510 [Verrucomicrobiales bacterium]|jgi:hypothetical protein